MENQLTLRLPADLAAKLARSAKQQKRRRSEVVRAALEQYLNTEPNVRPIEQVHQSLSALRQCRFEGCVKIVGASHSQGL